MLNHKKLFEEWALLPPDVANNFATLSARSSGLANTPLMASCVKRPWVINREIRAYEFSRLLKRRLESEAGLIPRPLPHDKQTTSPGECQSPRTKTKCDMTKEVDGPILLSTGGDEIPICCAAVGILIDAVESGVQAMCTWL